MLDVNNPEIRFAMNAVRQAALLVQGIQLELVSPALTKKDRSPVTIADFASQALVGWLLSETFPGDKLIAEEDSTALGLPEGADSLTQVAGFVGRVCKQADVDSVIHWLDYGRTDSSPRFWTLDPIDGTKGFLRGEQYAVALALVEGGEVRVGALGIPNLSDAYRTDPYGEGTLVIAARGQGTWTGSLAATSPLLERLQVSRRKTPSNARILRSVESGHTNVSKIDEFIASLGVEAEAVQMDSQAKYAVLAAGKGDILLRLLSSDRPDYREKIWDQAAGALILEEAGGRITDLQGRSLDFTRGRTLERNRGILATNGLLHEAALQALERIGA